MVKKTMVDLQSIVVAHRDPTKEDEANPSATMTVWVSTEYRPWRIFVMHKGGNEWSFEGKFIHARNQG